MWGDQINFELTYKIEPHIIELSFSRCIMTYIRFGSYRLTNHDSLQVQIITLDKVKIYRF
jgi:hypothetical protein